MWKRLKSVWRRFKLAGYKPGEQIAIALDPATSEFYQDGKYVFKKSDKNSKTSEQMAEYWADWVRQYPIVSIEDGLAEDDWEGWKLLTEKVGKKIQLVGDDLFVTNVKRLRRESIAAWQIRSDQSKPDRHSYRDLESIELARQNQYTSVISHRSARTEDTFIADLAVGTGAGQIKTGSASRTDRIAKYNQLLRIEEELGPAARFMGLKALNFHGDSKAKVTA